MNNVTKLLVATALLGLFIYACSPGLLHLLRNPTAWELREQLVFVTGVWAMSFMVLTVLVSARFSYINKLTGGLDKAYVVHKWAGIFTTLFGMTHWLLENVPHWLVAWNILANPGELTDGSLFSELEIALFQSGVLLAELSFYILLILVAIALVNKIPYRIFRVTHKIFPGLFLLFAWHAGTAQQKEHWLSSPAGYMLLALLALGSLAAITGLLQQIGRSCRTTAIVKSATPLSPGILDIQMEPVGKHFTHLPGQYAFLTFAHHAEPHPFSIASYTTGGALRFIVKDLGDFTHALPHAIQPGQRVVLEGPYGEFTFEDDCPHQLWIAAGIGITPFLSRLAYLTYNGGKKQHIDLWYCTRGNLNEQLPVELEALCHASAVDLLHINSARARLSIHTLLDRHRSFANASVWFCGPEEMGRVLQKKLYKHGLPRNRFHYDHFWMR